MKHISILVPRGAAALSCIEGSFIMFTKANDFLASRGRQPLFKVQLVGLSSEPQVYDRLFSVRPDVTIAEVHRTDLIVIPAVNGDRAEVIESNRGFLPWIVRQYKGGAEVASLCVGAFLLAATGLLKGRKCATHWLAANDFRKLFPDVSLVSDKIITDEGGIYSSGGALSFWNLLLYLVEKYTDRAVAIFASKFYEIEMDRDSQSSFLIFNGQRDHQDAAVKKVQEFIESNYHNKKRVRIEAAKRSLETSRKNINEVMYEAGYSDTKAFRTIFSRIAGMSPMDYRHRYNKEAALA
ncbi:MAG: DJ-1/PfpI family protein [Spirochaetia bacterium]